MLDRAFHKALPVGHVFAGKEHLAVRLLEQRTNAEPLAGAVDGVRAMYPWVVLPGLIDGVDERGCGASAETAFRSRINWAWRSGLGLRGEHIGLVSNRVGAEDAARSGLPLRGVEVLMRGLIAHQREVFRRPEAAIEEHLRLDDAAVLELIGGERFARGRAADRSGWS